MLMDFINSAKLNCKAAAKTFLLGASLLFFFKFSHAEVVVFNLAGLQDSERVLNNPDKGWYHHYYDNSLKKYLLKSDSDLDGFPNMQYLFLRFAWCYLEPKEGEFNWSLIDGAISKWKTKGIKVAIAVTAQETSEVYAVPKWVVDAGATGGMYPLLWDKKKKLFEPDYGNPVFLEKLEKLQKAIAERYDGGENIVSFTIASIGNWGEGHHLCTSRTAVSVDVIKKHIDIYKKHFKKTPLYINDDLMKYLRTPDEIRDLREYVESRKIGYKDDSILVGTSYAADPSKKSFLSGEFFDASYDYLPVVLEMEHYTLSLKSGLWKGKNGSERGADDVREIVEKSRCTYLGYHGEAAKYLSENPDYVREMANKLGYWFFVDELVLDTGSGAVEIAWDNRGAARAYEPYKIFLKFKSAGGKFEKTLRVKGADVCKLHSGKTRQSCFVDFGFLPRGEYEIYIGMLKTFKNGAKPRPIELGFKESLRGADGFYRLGKVKL